MTTKNAVYRELKLNDKLFFNLNSTEEFILFSGEDDEVHIINKAEAKRLGDWLIRIAKDMEDSHES